MKIRSGFVSNSSSASFILGEIKEPLLQKALEAVGETIHLSLKDIARQMLLSSNRSDLIYWLDKIPDNTKYIVFNSINYETEIFDLGPGVIILTCNNEYDAWEHAFGVLDKKYGIKSNYIEESLLYEDFVNDNEYYDYGEIDVSCVRGHKTYTHYSMAKISKKYGPAAYICERGVMLYENKKRICIK